MVLPLFKILASFVSAVLTVFGTLGMPTTMQEPQIDAPASVQMPLEQTKILEWWISFYAKQYGVSEAILREIVKCESGWDITAEGDDGYSWGLVQIHLPSHPYITKQQALDPKFSAEFIAKEFSKGNAWKWWSCYQPIN